MAITLNDFNKIWASTSPLTPYSFTEDNYKNGWNFIGSTPPSRQMWDSIQNQNDEKLKYIVDNFLPLSGGTMTGNIASSSNDMFTIRKSGITNQGVRFWGGDTFANGSSLYLYGKDQNAGMFSLHAHNGTNDKQLTGKPDGTLTWDGISITDGTFLTTRNVTVNVTTTGTGVKVGTATAPAVSKYQFVCWTYCVSSGGVFSAYPSSPQNSTSDIWAINPISNSQVNCHALYVRKW